MTTILAGFLLAAAQRGEYTDTVQLTDRTVTGQVEEDTIRRVRVKVGRRTETIEAAEVVNVEYADQPQEYREAMGEYRGGRWARAIELLQRARETVTALRNNPRSERRPPREWFESYCAFYLAESMRRNLNFDGAATEYQRILDQFAQFRARKAVYLGLLQCQVETRQLEAAQALVERIRGEEEALGAGTGDLAQAQYLEGLIKAEQFDQAIIEYKKLLTSPDEAVVLQAVRKIFEALRRGGADAARIASEAQEIQTQVTSPVARAAAAIEGARAQARQARESRREQDLYDALTALIDATVVRFPGKGCGLDAEHAAAVLDRAEIYEALAGATDKPKAQNLLRTQALRTCRELMALYPAAPEVQQAMEKAAALEGQIQAIDEEGE